MFWHNFKYAGKMLIKGKDTLFWTILFPIALFTFMYMAFGNIMEKDEMFKDIPVAVVRDGENDTALMMVLSTLSMDGEDKRIDMEVLSEKEALQKLKDTNLSENEVETLLMKANTGPFWKKYAAISGMFRAASLYENKGASGIRNAIKSSLLEVQ